ncbi:MAG: NAD(P)H-dependent oxidoreductase subunit E [Spirochaetales bacterium]|nr:NAD(P)H-dependent oxidoreductase subunit E [Spirochaetales bacterium]
MKTTDITRVEHILNTYRGKRGILIQLLLDIQHEMGWISPYAIDLVHKRMKIPLSRIYRIASFYKAMSLVPMGKYLVRVCLGTACHVRGGGKIMEKLEDLLGLEGEGTTGDGKFTLERVNCLGCCALGPVMVINDVYYSNVEPQKIEGILKEYE